jgi:hypothetical protein
MERRFRATVWPGTLPPVTRVETLGPYRLDGDLIKLDLNEAQIRTVDIPDELYLRELRDLDLDRPSAIIDFTNTYGRLGHLHPPVARNDAIPDRSEGPDTPVHDRRLIRLLGVRVPDERTLDWDSWHKEVTTHPQAKNWEAFETSRFIDNGLQHVDTFRAWAETFHILTDTYHKYMDLTADSEDVADLTSILTELLSPFSPTIQVRYDWEADTDFDPFENTYPRLESVLALQMYRHIAAEDVYMPCQNEPCGRLFVHQRGRAEHNQYRGFGVKYCSKNCAKAQVERQRRRRIKDEKG